MATKTVFTCQHCGYQSPKWLGRCPECAQWNSLIEELYNDTPDKRSSSLSDIVSASSIQRLSQVETKDYMRTSTNIGELDRVLGGGLVKGSVVLIGGEPGIGKSTLMLQVSHIISSKKKVLYISGEESLRQLKLRADRLNISSENLYMLNETNIDLITNHIKQLRPDLVVIDSVQILYNPLLSQTPGSVTQIRESAGALTVLAKALDISIFIIGHITKEGFIAGPKVLEHIVDCVIYFEGEKQSSFRILRVIKNRFGPTNEIGIFSMTAGGLAEIKDPSGIFISNRLDRMLGTAIMAMIEGTRPLLLEVQALVSRSNFGMSRQRSTGFDLNRMILLVAVIEKNLGLNLANHDVFLNVVGGARVDEPACDLAACAAIISSFKEQPLSQDTVVIGEVGLTAEVRSVSQVQARINEAQRMGFAKAIIPEADSKSLHANSKIKIIGVESVKQALDEIIR